MKETIKLGVILFLFAAVTAGILAYANSITSVIIADRQAQELADSLGVVFPDADNFEPIDEAKLGEIQASNEKVVNIYNAMKGSEQIGYVLDMLGSGYGGEFNYITGIDTANKAITGFKMMSHGETPGFGAKAAEPEFEAGTVGATAGSEIQGISGATVTTGAISSSIDEAFAAMGMVTGEVVAEDPAEVQMAAVQAAYPDADEFVEGEGNGDMVQTIYTANQGGSPVGHVAVVKAPEGYGGDITFALGIDNNGAVVGFAPIEHGETPGFGAALEEPEFASSVLGATDAEIEGISGATVTTTALKAGFAQAFEATQALR